jgi:hypothetical protein
VLQQQGRVQLDADANEQTAILLHYLRTLASDLIGAWGGPAGDALGFAIGTTTKPNSQELADLTIGAGRYYVDGILCENEATLEATPPPEKQRGRTRAEEAAQPASYYNQGDLYLSADTNKLPDPPFLVYLDVWERLITAAEDADIRDPALGLGGPDTAARARIVWQVRVSARLPENVMLDDHTDEQIRAAVAQRWEEWTRSRQPDDRGRLQARGRSGEPDITDVCIVDPEARYRGAENQLYRVEIHGGGAAGSASFKWSRENGSVALPIESLQGTLVTLGSLGSDPSLGLQVGDWVEVADDGAALWSDAVEPEPQGGITPQPARALAKILAINALDRIVTLDREIDGDVGSELARHPLLRRWDQQAGDPRLGAPRMNKRAGAYDGTLQLEENKWLTLEDGVQIFFAPADGEGNRYRAGDYWIVPARTTTGDVLWPGEPDDPETRPPHGVEHHYAPLAIVLTGRVIDLRHAFSPLAATGVGDTPTRRRR